MPNARVKHQIMRIERDLCIFLTAIEDDYEGPQLDNGKVTEDFVKQLMDTFRDQKKLHRKYAYQVFLLNRLPPYMTIVVCSLICFYNLVACIANIMDPDQTAPLGS